jgi:hypothetical protein
MPETSRRRILCIRPRPQAAATDPIACDWTVGLARHAEVTTVEGDADLAALCADAQPDLIVLESCSRLRPWLPSIREPRACPEIPRALFVTGEPYEPLRGLSMRLAGDLGVEAVFVPGEAYRQAMPELGFLRCYLAPLTVDASLYCDRGADKVIPVTVLDSDVEPGLNGWRTELLAGVRTTLPSLAYPQGSIEAGRRDFPLEPEQHATLFAQSWFCAVDTTCFDRVAPDHLAAAAGAVLIAPPSDALAAYGFVDRENCLLGSARDLVQRIDAVSRDPATYERIRKAGAALVAGRHAGTAPPVLLDWFECRQRLRPGQIVQQVDRYGPFRAVTPTFSTPSVLAAPVRDSVMVQVLRRARTAILSGEALMGALAAIDEAARASAPAAEPLFLFSLFALLNGKAVEAAMGIGARAETLGAQDDRLAAFDPVEAAWLMLIGRLLGHAPLEAAMREQASVMRHLSLRRMIWLLDAVETDIAIDETLLARQPDDIVSVHWLGQEDFTQWADLIRRVLMANRAAPGHATVARRLLAAA